jgi:hypothetical protein
MGFLQLLPNSSSFLCWMQVIKQSSSMQVKPLNHNCCSAELTLCVIIITLWWESPQNLSSATCKVGGSATLFESTAELGDSRGAHTCLHEFVVNTMVLLFFCATQSSALQVLCVLLAW